MPLWKVLPEAPERISPADQHGRTLVGNLPVKTRVLRPPDNPWCWSFSFLEPDKEQLHAFISRCQLGSCVWGTDGELYLQELQNLNSLVDKTLGMKSLSWRLLQVAYRMTGSAQTAPSLLQPFHFAFELLLTGASLCTNLTLGHSQSKLRFLFCFPGNL